MALQHANRSGRSRIFIALLAIIGGLLVGMAVGLLVDPGETKKAVIARILW